MEWLVPPPIQVHTRACPFVAPFRRGVLVVAGLSPGKVLFWLGWSGYVAGKCRFEGTSTIRGAGYIGSELARLHLVAACSGLSQNMRGEARRRRGMGFLMSMVAEEINHTQRQPQPVSHDERARRKGRRAYAPVSVAAPATPFAFPVTKGTRAQSTVEWNEFGPAGCKMMQPSAVGAEQCVPPSPGGEP